MSRFMRHMMKASGNRINFAGKFSDDSTPDDWWWKPNGVKKSIARRVNSKTKEFAFAWNGKLTSVENLFYKSKIERIYLLPELSNVTTMRSMFCECSMLKEVTFPDTDFDSLTSMINIFCDCSSIETIDISPLRLGDNKIKMQGMFARCYKLKYVDLTNFEFENMADPTWMFKDSSELQHIKVTKSFYDFSHTRTTYLCLPDSFKDGGTGIWEIVD